MIRVLKATTLLFLGAVTVVSLSTPCSADYLVTWSGFRLHPYKNKPFIPGVTRVKAVFKIADLPPVGKCSYYSPPLIKYTDGVDTLETLAAAGYMYQPTDALQFCRDRNNSLYDGHTFGAFLKLDQDGKAIDEYVWEGRTDFPPGDTVVFYDYVNHKSIGDHHAPLGATLTAREVGK